jgi:DNA gyrase subunit A
MKQDDDRGNLVGGFIVVDGDEVLAIKQSGQVTRSAIDSSLRAASRDTKGVRFVGVGDGDAVAVVARSVETVDGPVFVVAAVDAEDAEDAAEIVEAVLEPGLDEGVGVEDAMIGDHDNVADGGDEADTEES